MKGQDDSPVTRDLYITVYKGVLVSRTSAVRTATKCYKLNLNLVEQGIKVHVKHLVIKLI